MTSIGRLMSAFTSGDPADMVAFLLDRQAEDHQPRDEDAAVRVARFWLAGNSSDLTEDTVRAAAVARGII